MAWPGEEPAVHCSVGDRLRREEQDSLTLENPLQLRHSLARGRVVGAGPKGAWCCEKINNNTRTEQLSCQMNGTGTRRQQYQGLRH